MNESFIVYNDSAISNRLSEFPATLAQTETRILTYTFLSGPKLLSYAISTSLISVFGKLSQLHVIVYGC